jgi:Spy/CpxP family protein refolding chaperone
MNWPDSYFKRAHTHQAAPEGRPASSSRHARTAALASRGLVVGVLAVFSAAMAVGCGATQGVDEEVDSAAAEIDGAEEHAGQPRRRGPGDMIKSVALHELELTAEQRTKIEALFHGPSDEVREEHASKARALADAVRAGRVDVAAFAAKDTGRPDLRARFAAELDALHAVLTSEQRAELVAALRERAPKGPPDGRDREGRPDHPGAGGPLGFLVHGLELTDAQQDAIAKDLADAGLGLDAGRRKKPDHAAMKVKIDAAMEAFLQEDFEAEAVLPEPPEGARGPQAMVRRLAIVVPHLTGAQRAKLADRIEAGPPRRRPDGG